MKIVEFETLDQITLHQQENPVFITMGAFDAIHLGHQDLINKTVATAKSNNVSSGLITFHQHPRSIIQTSKSSSLVFPLNKKLNLINEFNLDFVFLIHFTDEIMNLSHEDFFHKILLNHLNVRGLIIGENFCFGKNRKGNISYLQNQSENYLDLLEVVNISESNLSEVSTSNIKNHLKNGDIELVNEYLGRKYSVEGLVIKGDGRGKQLGFPTLNLPPQSSFIPRAGVYITTSQINQKSYDSITNIGTKPTFNFSNPIQEYTIETHLLNCEFEEKVSLIKVEFHHFIRDEIQFEDQFELISQIQKDIIQAKEFHESN
ncbi:MAG: hypothetical protein COA79_00880 [Planctomycetota bacterium]|nr:MAG: hypothetical protein COA79_00880 [Planctomycetota bacterium]